MKNEAFIKQQLEYISLFSALTRVINKESALKIMDSVTAYKTAAASRFITRITPISRILADPFAIMRLLYVPDSKRQNK